MPSVKHIFCHPIKAVGRTNLDTVQLVAGETLLHDRMFAITHEVSKFDLNAPAWVNCNNFIRGAKAPELQAISISQYAVGGLMVLNHPDHPAFSFDPDNADDHARFIGWVSQFVPDNRAQPAAFIKAPTQGMTDSSHPYISILNLASLKELSIKAGRPMAPERFRGNIWLDGLDMWAEHDWIGKTMRIGQAEVVIREPIGRCMATTADPLTGKQDVNTLDILQNNWGHTEFGVYAEVIKSGDVDLSDAAHIL